MSTIEETTVNSTATVLSESKYRSMFKPSKFIWRNNKTSPTGSPDFRDTINGLPSEEAVVPHSMMKLPSMKLPSPSIPSFGKKHSNLVALKETGMKEVYELSTVNDSGVYLIPTASSPLSNKHDHWLHNDKEDAFCFSLPSYDCLTTVSGRPHSFYTPSSIIIHA
ncbi:hypothetical protein BCR42DRAFT_402567 [Absidia repens]|uniref:Uncharacterized protein n=1 Tax=Absidia repens TaxID=90262 RepID=A0A1X2IYC3_9FUNG|nr:hypothetical protein BCR42DRAFT_402567 [Absidia repens]